MGMGAGHDGGKRVKVYVHRSTSGSWHVVKLIPPILSTSGNSPAVPGIDEKTFAPQGKGPDAQ